MMTILLTSCGTVSSSCPTVTKINPEIQRKAADQLQEIGVDSPMGQVLTAALKDRNKMRACIEIEKKYRLFSK